MTGLDADRLVALLERLVVACERIAGRASPEDEAPSTPPGTSESELLGPKQVARLLGCSYGEARQRMLDGRIRAVKDGRWCRTRREWVEEYLDRQAVRPQKHEATAPPVPPRRKRAAPVKAGGIAAEFLRERQG